MVQVMDVVSALSFLKIIHHHRLLVTLIACSSMCCLRRFVHLVHRWLIDSSPRILPCMHRRQLPAPPRWMHPTHLCARRGCYLSR
jgi:hypothetical protein